jgi:hypothetical protein
MPFIESSDINWNDFLKNENHDLYHLPEYAELDASLHGGKAMAWVCDYGDCKCLMPLISRPVNNRSVTMGSQNLRDLCSPYGYPGVLTSVPLPPGDAMDMLLQFHRDASQHKFVSSFIRLNPFLNNWNLPISSIIKQISESREINQISDAGMMKQIYYGETVSINLAEYNKDLNCFNQNHRRNLKSLHRHGLQVVVNDFSLMPHFIEAYYQTMRRRKATKYYFFPHKYFSTLKQLANNNLIFISVLLPTGQYISGGLFTVYGSVMQYHLGATIDSAVQLSPSKLVIETAIQSGLENGASTLHLGGGLGGSKTDGVFRFKAGFSNDRHTYSCLQFIHDSDAYYQLSIHSANKQSNAAITKAQQSIQTRMINTSAIQPNHSNPDYFPQYRSSNG